LRTSRSYWTAPRRVCLRMRVGPGEEREVEVDHPAASGQRPRGLGGWTFSASDFPVASGLNERDATVVPASVHPNPESAPSPIPLKLSHQAFRDHDLIIFTGRGRRQRWLNTCVAARESLKQLCRALRNEVVSFNMHSLVMRKLLEHKFITISHGNAPLYHYRSVRLPIEKSPQSGHRIDSKFERLRIGPSCLRIGPSCLRIGPSCLRVCPAP
jgi:hypothetical protein